MTIAYRPATAPDRDVIRATWSSSYKKSHSAGITHTDDWAEFMHRTIDRIWTRYPDSRAIVAYENTDPDFVYGWIAGDTSDPTNPIVYYCYVKEPYRLAGYARGLMAAFGVDPKQPFTYVCRTPVIPKLQDKIPRADWNPLEVRYPKETRRRHGRREDRYR